jgi:hypothetical protein
MEVHPVVLYPRERVVLFGALSKTSNEVFRALFADTFDVQLSALTPFHRAIELLEARGGGEALAALRRTSFVPASASPLADRLRTSSAADAVAAMRESAAGRRPLGEETLR